MIFRFLLLAILSLSLSSCVATAIVGGGAAAGSALHDKRSVGQHFDDVAIASKIDALLIAEKDMPSRWVSVEVIENVVWLTGYLPSQNHIDRAVYICRSVKDVREVRSQLNIGSPSAKSLFSDSWITTKIKSAFLDDEMISGFSIHIETVDGKVYLQGIVDRSEQRYRAKEIVQRIDGVTGVVDLLRVRASK
ncbi:MAG: BON domain-containing protein [Mariprofundaceae bacterium]